MTSDLGLFPSFIIPRSSFIVPRFLLLPFAFCLLPFDFSEGAVRSAPSRWRVVRALHRFPVEIYFVTKVYETSNDVCRSLSHSTFPPRRRQDIRIRHIDRMTALPFF
jgi:hypothetical protein